MALVPREATEIGTGWIGSVNLPAEHEGAQPGDIVTVPAEIVLCQDGTAKLRQPHQQEPPTSEPPELGAQPEE